MESKLESIVDTMMQTDKTIGVLVADNQGLAYTTRGVANANASGVITSIAEQASRIHPNLDAPVVILESDKASVTISRYTALYTGAVYKKTKK